MEPPDLLDQDSYASFIALRSLRIYVLCDSKLKSSHITITAFNLLCI